MLYMSLKCDLGRLGKEINQFIKALEIKHKSW